jgi:hypothetical protein
LLENGARRRSSGYGHSRIDDLAERVEHLAEDYAAIVDEIGSIGGGSTSRHSITCIGA